MDVTELSFNKQLGIERADDPGCLLCLKDEETLHNHLGSLHASALFSLAEASSAEFLLRHRGERPDVGGVVRKASCKYSTSANGTITSLSPTPVSDLEKAIDAVDKKGRALLTIDIVLRNEAATNVAMFSFTWFLAKDE